MGISSGERRPPSKLERAVFREWQVNLYKYKDTSSSLHDAGVDE